MPLTHVLIDALPDSYHLPAAISHFLLYYFLYFLLPALVYAIFYHRLSVVDVDCSFCPVQAVHEILHHHPHVEEQAYFLSLSLLLQLFQEDAVGEYVLVT